MSEWIRVTREHRCPVCGHDTWCCVANGAILCMRQAGGKQITLRSGEIGWIHRDQGQTAPQPQHREREPEPVINVGALLQKWRRNPNNRGLERFARYLGVRASALMELGCVHAPYPSTWAFPMRDGFGNFVGIRLRSQDGRKWAVKGSHQGIFFPQTRAQELGFVCEGPTDCAAALSLGLYAVGRPSCAGGMQDVRTAFNRMGVRRAVVISDNDDPGLRGAEMLSRQLPIPTCIMVLPCKDIRQFLNDGGTPDDVECLLKGLLWRQPENENDPRTDQMRQA